MGLNTAQAKRKRRYGNTFGVGDRARAKTRARSGPGAIVPRERQAGKMPERPPSLNHRSKQKKSCNELMEHLQALPCHERS